MAKPIKADQLAVSVNDILEEFKDAVNVITEDNVKEVMNEARADVRARSPQREKGSKSYKSHWRTKFIHEGRIIKGIVYNDKAGLTHLLEFGHAIQGGGRTAAQEHIGPAQETASEKFERSIRRGLESI